MTLHLGVETKQQFGQDFAGAFAGLVAHGLIGNCGRARPRYFVPSLGDTKRFDTWGAAARDVHTG